MDCVNMSEAARIAGVSRQRLTNMRRDSEEGRCPYSFFVVDMESGKKYVDTDNGDWKHYVEKNKNNPNKKKPQEKETGQVSISDSSDDSAAFSALIQACTDSVQELFKPSAKKLNELNDLIKNKFGEMMG